VKLRTFLRFFQNPKKHIIDFLRFFEWLTTFSRTLLPTDVLAANSQNVSRRRLKTSFHCRFQRQVVSVTYIASASVS